jgi:uncharacterized LabA/DUF88 family protein
MMDDTCVFLDGAYLSILNKYFGGGKPLEIDINQFAYTLAKSEGLWCKGVYYYTAPPFQSDPPTPDEVRRRGNYDRFINHLKRFPNFTVREGRCQKVEGEFHQKGVDTLFTMDLFEACKNKDIKTIIVLTCDTDFVPILNKLRESGIRVILYYFNDFKRGSKFSMSNHLHTACDVNRLLTMDHFQRSLRRKPEPLPSAEE